MYFLVTVLLHGTCNNISDSLKDLSKLTCNCNYSENDVKGTLMNVSER